MKFVSKKNIYEYIVEELVALIESGALRYGDKLPSVRAYAIDKKVNPNTVAKAYSVLEERGYVRIELKKGGYVCYGEETLSEENDLCRQIAVLKGMGITKAELQRAIEEVYKEE